MASNADLRKRIQKLVKETIETHCFCDIGNPRHCDLYFNLTNDIESIVSEAVDGLREPMRCGHPAACLSDGGCLACRREQDVAHQARLVEMGE